MWPRVDGLRALELGTAGRMRAQLNDLVLEGRLVEVAEGQQA